MFYKKLLVSLFLMFMAVAAIADDSQRHQKVDGMSIYLGVIPAQLTQEHYKMHGGVVKEEHSYHINLALFDDKTKKRITDAKIKATVSALGLSGESKVLEPMHGGELLSYGNYFTMYKATQYRIKVAIDRGDKGGKSIVEFIFKRPLD